MLPEEGNKDKETIESGSAVLRSQVKTEGACWQSPVPRLTIKHYRLTSHNRPTISYHNDDVFQLSSAHYNWETRGPLLRAQLAATRESEVGRGRRVHHIAGSPAHL